MIGAARITYGDAKSGIDETRDVVLTTPIADGPIPVDWDRAEPASFAATDLSNEAPAGCAYDPPPSGLVTPKAVAQWAKDFARWVAQSQTIELLKSPRARLVSHPDEAERDFRIRLQMTLREGRDQAVADVRARYASKLAAMDDRVRRADAAVKREEEQASESKLQSGVSVAATIFGALLGRKAVSASTLGRATTAARSVSRIGRATQDVARAQQELQALVARRDELAAALEQDLETVASRWDAHDETLERVVVKPRRGGVSVQLVGVVWQPD